jgi:hypothetical protein
MRGTIETSLVCRWALLVAVAWGGGCNKLMDTGAAADAAAGSAALTRESHGMYFPIGSGSYHPTETCDDCHGGFSDFRQFTCQSCHAHEPDVATMRHTFVTGFMNVSSACYTCHPNGRESVISVADHSAKYFAIDSGPHSALQCSDCHTWVTTSRPFTCVSCHTHDTDPTAAAHSAITGYRYDSNGCFGCHPNGGEAAIARSDHDAQYFPLLTGSHQTAACTDCHTDPTTSKTFVCTTCHTQSDSAKQHGDVSGYAWNDAGCFTCHPRDQ